jgi:hypothetical protein
MNKLEETIVQDFGLDQLSAEVKKAALNDIYATIDMRVSMRLAHQMTEEQLATFDSLKHKDDKAVFTKWVQETFPKYSQIVAEELQALKAEVNNGGASILDTLRNLNSSAS